MITRLENVNIQENHTSGSQSSMAPVSGFARSFLTSNPIENATITIIEDGQEFRTNKDGRFGPFQWEVGRDITLVLSKKGYRTTQTATFTVPPEGLNDSLHEISFQVPSDFAFTLFSFAMGVTIDENACQVATTITAHHKTMDDIPQGEANALAMLSPDPKIKPFYFGIFEKGPFKNKTKPFPNDLNETTEDGGVGFLNVPPSPDPYFLSAFKNGRCFSTVKLFARRGVFVNISPPNGPMVLHTDQNQQDQSECQDFASVNSPIR